MRNALSYQLNEVREFICNRVRKAQQSGHLSSSRKIDNHSYLSLIDRIAKHQQKQLFEDLFPQECCYVYRSIFGSLKKENSLFVKASRLQIFKLILIANFWKTSH